MPGFDSGDREFGQSAHVFQSGQLGSGGSEDSACQAIAGNALDELLPACFTRPCSGSSESFEEQGLCAGVVVTGKLVRPDIA